MPLKESNVAFAVVRKKASSKDAFNKDASLCFVGMLAVFVENLTKDVNIH